MSPIKLNEVKQDEQFHVGKKKIPGTAVRKTLNA